MKKYDLIVVGGGPAGMIAAGHAAESGLSVLLIEKMKLPGRKLGITGKGRCNITNIADVEDYIDEIYPDGRFMRSSFSMFFNQELIDFMSRIGIKTETERGGRVFPAKGRATDIVQKLIIWLAASGVKTVVNTKVTRILTDNGKVKGVETIDSTGTNRRERFFGANILIATGGLSYPATGSTGDGYRFAKELGHNVIQRYPSLVPLETRSRHLKNLKGLTLKNVNATIFINNTKWKEAFGEMAFTENSITGPIILTLSRDLTKRINNENRVVVSIDLKPALDNAKLESRIQRDMDQFSKLDIRNILRKLLPSQMVAVCLNQLSLDQNTKGSMVGPEERIKLRNWLKDLRFEISGFRPYSEAIITAGGVDTKEINQRSFMSRHVEGLYFAGEILDLDGPTGGYNLQIAFTTGWCASEALIKKPR